MKRTISTVCNLVSAALALIFVAKTILDGFGYDTVLNSAPFWVFVLRNAVVFLIPAILVFAVGIIIKKRP